MCNKFIRGEFLNHAEWKCFILFDLDEEYSLNGWVILRKKIDQKCKLNNLEEFILNCVGSCC